jgi:hypothetical protein
MSIFLSRTVDVENKRKGHYHVRDRTFLSKGCSEVHAERNGHNERKAAGRVSELNARFNNPASL